MPRHAEATVELQTRQSTNTLSFEKTICINDLDLCLQTKHMESSGAFRKKRDNITIIKTRMPFSFADQQPRIFNSNTVYTIF